jgi:hypothetical protein
MDVSFKKHDSYLEIITAGEWEPQPVIANIDLLKEMAEKMNYNHLLLDATLLGLPKTEMTRLLTGEYIAKMLPPPFKIACLTSVASYNRFTENVAVNRGAQFAVFLNHQAALKWLLGQ